MDKYDLFNLVYMQQNQQVRQYDVIETGAISSSISKDTNLLLSNNNEQKLSLVIVNQ